ncbi:MAG TPA: AAA family ATPase [Polyangiaceae bacterium]|nr:AAA family ATPase [Polyangiaceae bacterium]
MLVGRSRELAGLEQLVEDAARGGGGLRVLVGEPGIGKTRLADEIASRAASRAFTVAWGRACETGGAPAYWPWIEVLGPLAEREVDLAPRVAALLDRVAAAPHGEGTRADPARERFELFEGVSSFLRGAARRAPLLLVFDDLHAADVATLELLFYVARGLRTSRIAIVGTWRDAESRLAPVSDVLARITREGTTFALGPLSGDDVAEIVRQDVGSTDVPFTAAVFALTEGNPLFLRETLHAVAADRRSPPLEALRTLRVAGGVLALVRSRMEGADQGLRALLETAAVVGRVVPLALLTQVYGGPVDEVERSLEEAANRGLLVRRHDDRWIFSHVLVREAFYEAIDGASRSRIHAAVAAVLQRLVASGEAQQLPTLAHHALAALPTGSPADAIRTARLAADRARSQLAYEEAIALLERAFSTCDRFAVDEHERAEVELALGWAATEAGRLEQGRELFRRAAQIARRLGDARLLARAALGQGGEYVLAEIRDELVDGLREALVALGDPPQADDKRLRARLLARLAAALTPSATPEEPLGLAREALDLARDEVDERTRIDVAVGVGAALTDFAPPDQRIPVNEALLRDARTAGDRVLRLRALNRLACDHLERGDVAAADAVIAARAALADSLGHPRYRWQTPLLRSMRAMPDGRFDDCEAEIAEARRIAAETADPNAARCIEIHRLSMLFVAGRGDPLREQEGAALRVLEPLPDRVSLQSWVSATVAARLGDPVRAAHALRAMGPSSVMTARMSRATIAEAALAAGIVEIYERLYRTFPADEGANASWGPFAFVCGPPIARILGAVAFALGKVDAAVKHCELALATADRMGADAHRAWVHLTWGEGLARTPEGREHLQTAHDVAQRLRMPDVVARAAAALELGKAGAARGVAPIPARSAPPTFSLRRESKDWAIEHGGRTFHLKDVRGLGMLAALVESPGREIHAVDLASDPSADAPGGIDLGDSGEVIDARAREEYRRRIEELREEVAEAECFADTARAARLRYELDALTDQIAGAVGLGGRARRSGSAAERARIVVQRRVREAIKRIADADAELGRHLDWTVRTGTFCAYEPEGRRSAH